MITNRFRNALGTLVLTIVVSGCGSTEDDTNFLGLPCNGERDEPSLTIEISVANGSTGAVDVLHRFNGSAPIAGQCSEICTLGRLPGTFEVTLSKQGFQPVSRTYTIESQRKNGCSVPVPQVDSVTLVPN